MRKRKGFTLIEVIVALAIFLILIFALVGSYYAYYNSVKEMVYRAVGQNIAELQMEDVRYMPVGILELLCNGGQYPTGGVGGVWQYYKLSVDSKYYIITDQSGADPNIPNAVPFPVDTNPDPNGYNSGKIDGAFRLERIDSILGVSGSFTLPTDELKNLPNNITIMPVQEVDDYGNPASIDYTILLNKEVYPYYKKKITITDETPNILNVENKIFNVNVTVYWTVGGHMDPSMPGQIIGGTEKHITVTTEKSAGQ